MIFLRLLIRLSLFGLLGALWLLAGTYLYLSPNLPDVETLRDFVGVGVAWRDYIRARYSREITVTDADVERALQADVVHLDLRGTGAFEHEDVPDVADVEVRCAGTDLVQQVRDLDGHMVPAAPPRGA